MLVQAQPGASLFFFFTSLETFSMFSNIQQKVKLYANLLNYTLFENLETIPTKYLSLVCVDLSEDGALTYGQREVKTCTLGNFTTCPTKEG